VDGITSIVTPFCALETGMAASARRIPAEKIHQPVRPSTRRQPQSQLEAKGSRGKGRPEREDPNTVYPSNLGKGEKKEDGGDSER